MREIETLALPYHHPPTPPSGDLPYDLHHLVESNNSSIRKNHQISGRQSSPEANGAMNAQYMGRHYNADPHAGAGLGIQYEGYHQQPGYYADDHRSHSGSPFMQNSMPISSPPTPMSHHSETRRTRSGRSIVRNDSPHSMGTRSSPPRSRKKKTASNDKNKTPPLEAPLSVLTKDSNVPIRDMEAWVNRPVSERLAEAEKRNGYITRPMNSFMLYRSAYAERTKMWCMQNNHQVVSSVSGQSWPLEPPEVREFYNELAKLERMHHQAAHPDYKFSPSKPGVTSASSKKRSREDDEESEASDLDDPDWASMNGVRSRPSKRVGRESGYPSHHAPMEQQHHQFQEPYDRPITWDAPHQAPVNALPYHPQMQPHPQQFYPSPTMQHHQMQMMPPQHQQQHQPDPYAGAFDNVSFAANQNLIGIPGGSHTELLGLPSGMPTPMMEHQIDPMLMPYDGLQQHLSAEHGIPMPQHPGYEAHFDPRQPMAEYHGEPGGPLISDYKPREWQPEPEGPTFEESGHEFDKLWDEHEKAQNKEEGENEDRRIDVLGEEEQGQKSPKSS